MEFRVRRVYDAPARGEGRRVLVARLWPRGKSKAELDANPEGLAELRKALGRGTRATLLYSAHDAEHNNAVALAEYLAQSSTRQNTALR